MHNKPPMASKCDHTIQSHHFRQDQIDMDTSRDATNN